MTTQRFDYFAEREFDFTEMDKLEKYLKDNGYNYTRQALYDGQQIVVFDKNGNRAWDVVLHIGSYGMEDNLLEAMGETLLGHDDVEGYLTAEDVIRYIRHSDPNSDWTTSTAPIVQ